MWKTERKPDAINLLQRFEKRRFLQRPELSRRSGRAGCEEQTVHGTARGFIRGLHGRQFIEEALVAPVPGRSAELITQWSSSIDDLLTLAITHELGHALCNEEDEHKADAYGRLLRAGRLHVLQVDRGVALMADPWVQHKRPISAPSSLGQAQ